ncbi:hypothetical protein N7478_011820 [Penicillium angulare]|uniref:uncharacterized protein n=1 Tax=Penicillium angulare TaxID=116970 RepID=UPI0025407840|nr:uncharacterized protein N7478_011820 [Penicillium angulare]KAJ5261225.1 hypothetical protein N7478_011820 [Penicillium angulare]
MPSVGHQNQIGHQAGYPKPDQSQSSYPSLQALAAIQHASKIPKWITDSLQCFAVSSERGVAARQDQLLNSLKRVADELHNHQANDDDDWKSVIELNMSSDQTDRSHQVKALYQVVTKHGVCSCEPKSQRPMPTYLGLNEKKLFVHVEEHVTPFKLFFRGHSPDIHINGPVALFRETVIRIKKRSKATFSDKPEIPPPKRDFLEIQDNLCSIISRASSLLPLYFYIQDDKLQLEGPKGQSKHWIGDSHISLTELLGIKGFFTSRKKRLHLSHLAAKAAWECYDSGWMKNGLDRHDVHFMLEKSDCGRHKQLSSDEPFLTASFISHDKDESGWTDPIAESLNIHKCPKILAVGILLLEIELGRGIDEYRHLILEGDQTPDINTDYMTAVNVIDRMSEEWEERGTTSQHKAIIKACFNQDVLRGCEDVDSQRAALLTEIVVPLESLFRSQWEGEESQILPIIYKDIPDSLHTTEGRGPVAQLFSNIEESVPEPLEIDTMGTTMTVSDASSPSDKWLERIDKEFCSLLRAKSKADRKSYAPVKIAVLDTGIHPQHYNVSNITDYKDFVNPLGQGKSDLTGHGSIGVSLTYKLLPNAQVYVGRVFETSQANNNTPVFLAQAIRHAKDVWGVDIITIASGFEDSYACIRDEIISESSNPPLIFSAASNDGNMGPIAFPASMRQCVMCMFASNGHAKPTQLSINPSARESGGSNFAILGEDVEVRFCDSVQPRRHSGTSIATFIGAAIAGVLLDFSKQPFGQQVVNPYHLKRIGGMSAVFKKMSVEDNGYNCIAPWSLFRSISIPTTSCVNSEDRRIIRRDELCKNISNFLIDAGL